ncbi:hypothetical protein AJ85_05760 [Alkalihalobacillus alcalophilus ATCC 27647 = CGMCC 1.3604]|uniref:5'-3' exonuclease n=1 Tax=Alkalihalobacillus alcalophilus ATCC 27647 = CGMCC 1.3604 TaxID=1218173 RepID=A0A4S4K5C4_ALKAL|nr:5'-3' exonuclease [Alkalihalobacillus alcalophilus]YP_009276820.1 5'-3' exonuclease [Bacillus phage BalMu-1]AJA42392.1 DNA polymerase I [Bacillus phage BalMu-1]AJA42448.1 DNA polymerase I [Bacillus phage BalMu-1]MED1561136.1 5'-3' exonuclease [Alkalihalobacillus alcalophilus]THG91329.1 hypothetical protein AJ85_05760 [Alkalihalobacillus alcalophilus ATCC 27647 = CGMCC 1.3604]
MKTVFVMMASHKASPRTFECEMKSLMIALRDMSGYNLDHARIENGRVTLHLTDKPSFGDYQVKSSQDGATATVVCHGFSNLSKTNLLEALSKMIRQVQKLDKVGMNRLTSAEIIGDTFTVQLMNENEIPQPKVNRSRTLLLIDGANLLSRGYFATSFRGDLMQNQDGLYTNGVYVFVKKLMRLIESFRATHVVVCWDVGRTETFRRQIYPDYKALRDETEPELKQQFETTEEVLRLMNIPQIRLRPYEADDLIGALSTKWVEQTNDDERCFIYSSDKDMFQLLDTGGHVLQVISRNKEDVVYSSTNFEKEYGVTPRQWIDVKSLLGETGKSSDNIPGCKGVGEKAAFPLVQSYGSLEGIYRQLDNLDKSFSRYRKKLEEGKENVELSKRLVTIIRDIPNIASDFEPYELHVNEQGKRKAYEWLNFTRT